MTILRDLSRSDQGPCLDDQELYLYISGTPGERDLASMQSHLAVCKKCRKELAAVLTMLKPEDGSAEEPDSKPTPEGIASTLGLIQGVARCETSKRGGRVAWVRWGAVAAAVLVGIAGAGMGTLYLSDQWRSQSFFEQAQEHLEKVYAPESPSSLRLDLPFRSSSEFRSAGSEDAYFNAQSLLFQTLAISPGKREAQLGLGYLHLQKNQYQKAREQFDKVLASRRDDLQALIGRGVSLYEEGSATVDPVVRTRQLSQALEDFTLALRMKPDSLEALFNRARLLYEMGRHGEARRVIDSYLKRDSTTKWAERLRELKSKIEMNRSENVEKEVGRAAAERDAQALQALVRIAPHQIPWAIRRALARSLELEATTIPKGQADAPTLRWAAEELAHAYRNATNDAGCFRVLEFYAGLSPPQKALKRRLDIRLERAIELYKANDIQAALRASKSLEDGFLQLGDHWQLARLHNLRGSSHHYGKLNSKAEEHEYRKMLHYAKLSGDPGLYAPALGSLSSTLSVSNDFDRAFPVLAELKQIADSHQMGPLSALARNHLGSNYLLLHDLQASLREFSQALAISYRDMAQQELIFALRNLGTVLEKMDRLEDARQFYRESGRWQDAFLRDGWVQATGEIMNLRMGLLYREGFLALKVHDLNTARNRFGQVLSSASSATEEVVTNARIGMAQINLEQGAFEEAAKEIESILQASSQGRLPALEWQAWVLKGILHSRNGDPSGAIEYFEKSADVVEEVRARVPSTKLKESFLTPRFDPYQEAVALLVELQKDPAEALRFVDRAKSQTLLESMSTTTGLVKRISPENGIDSIPQGLAMLEYFITPHVLYAFLSVNGKTNVATIKISSEVLGRQIDEYRESIRANRAAVFQPLSRSLHESLIGPVLPFLQDRNIDTLAILPDGPLHLLPFASLEDAQGRYLLERYRLVHAPSQSVLAACLMRNKPHSFSRNISLLLLEGAGNLPGASREVSDILGIFRIRRLVGGSDLETLHRTIDDFDVIHFTGHANLHYGSPRLVLQGPQGEVYLGAAQIRNWNLKRTGLVTLAGCETGVGPIYKGETPWGLLPAFLSAGASSILVSLFPLEDGATRELTVRFYEYLSQGSLSRAAALQQAQLDLLHPLGSSASLLPRTWAPFVLVGDPR